MKDIIEKFIKNLSIKNKGKLQTVEEFLKTQKNYEPEKERRKAKKTRTS